MSALDVHHGKSAASRSITPVVLFQLVVFATAVAFIAASVGARPGILVRGDHFLWVAMLALAELLPVPVWREARLDMSFPIGVAVAVLYPPFIAAFIAFVGAFDIREFKLQLPPGRALFNRSNIALSTAAVSVVIRLWTTPESGLGILAAATVVAALVGYALNLGLISIAMSLDYRVRMSEVLRRLTVGGPGTFLISYLGFGLLGLLLAHLYQEVGALALLTMVGPLLLARQAFFRSRQLEEAHSRYRVLVEQIPAATYIFPAGGQGSVEYVSPQIEAILGYPAKQWTKDPGLWLTILHPEDRDRVVALHPRGNPSGDRFRMEYRLVALDGRTVWIRDEAALLRDDNGRPTYWQGVVLDITAEKQAEEQVMFLAYHDKLTGLPNRMMFERVLDLALARAKRGSSNVAVLFMDLDNFKLVNDSLGHVAGDELLKAVAQRLRSVVREADFMARQGGDEFLIALADLDGGPARASEIAHGMADRIQQVLREPFLIAGTEMYTSASIGISMFPLDGANGADLLRYSDVRMYRSKRVGPGRATVAGLEGPDNALGQLSFVTRLRKATERKSWALHYQPIVDMRSGRMVGVESLVRWNHPQAGPISPSQFIPLAEELGLIGDIEEWVLGELCRQAHIWKGQGIDLGVSFNVSLRRLWGPDMAKQIVDMLESEGLSPRNVTIEITETTAMADPERTKRVLHDLHDHGLRVAIDDFGTAHSSLARLRQFEVDVLKIDQAFVRDAPIDAHAASMLTAIIGLARSLEVQPLAEGVETEDQRRLLVELGCALGQGFLFSPAVPAGQVPLLLSGGRLPLEP